MWEGCSTDTSSGEVTVPPHRLLSSFCGTQFSLATGLKVYGPTLTVSLDACLRSAYLRLIAKSLPVDELPENFCVKCGRQLQEDNAFCPKCGAPVGATGAAAAQAPAQPTARGGSSKGWGAGKWILVAVIIFIILIVPVFPRDTIVYVDGTTQTVTNQVQYSTSFQVYTTSTASQISVYTGSYQYFSNTYYNQYYNYWGGNNCYWYKNQIVCNYNYWPWYTPSYGTTVTITPNQQVVSVTRSQQNGGLESLTLTYYNGQSTTIQNIYSDNLSQSGTATVQSSAVVTNTVTNTITTPVTQTVPCHQCIPEHVTQHVSILQLIFGY